MTLPFTSIVSMTQRPLEVATIQARSSPGPPNGFLPADLCKGSGLRFENERVHSVIANWHPLSTNACGKVRLAIGIDELPTQYPSFADHAPEPLLTQKSKPCHPTLSPAYPLILIREPCTIQLALIENIVLDIGPNTTSRGGSG